MLSPTRHKRKGSACAVPTVSPCHPQAGLQVRVVTRRCRGLQTGRRHLASDGRSSRRGRRRDLRTPAACCRRRRGAADVTTQWGRGPASRDRGFRVRSESDVSGEHGSLRVRVGAAGLRLRSLPLGPFPAWAAPGSLGVARGHGIRFHGLHVLETRGTRTATLSNAQSQSSMGRDGPQRRAPVRTPAAARGGQTWVDCCGRRFVRTVSGAARGQGESLQPGVTPAGGESESLTRTRSARPGRVEPSDRDLRQSL